MVVKCVQLCGGKRRQGAATGHDATNVTATQEKYSQMMQLLSSYMLSKVLLG